MQSQFGEETPRQVQESQVLDDERVRADAGERLQVLEGQAQFTLFHQAVHGHVQPLAQTVGVVGHGGDLGEGEVAGQGPGVQAGGADVNGVGAGFQRRLKGGESAGRGEQFQVRGRGGRSGGSHGKQRKVGRGLRREAAYSAGGERASG